MEKVLLAIDGITPDEKAFYYAVELCSRIKAELNVLQIIRSQNANNLLDKAITKAKHAKLFFEGTMRGLFSMLFGAGIILMTSRAEARGAGLDVAEIYFRRNLWLIAFGLAHAWLLLWHGDILYRYGIAALFLFSFRKLSPRTLIILGMLIIFALSARDMYWHFDLSNIHEQANAAQVLPDAGEELSEDQQAAIDALGEEIGGWPPDDETSTAWLREHPAAKHRMKTSERDALMARLL